MYIDLKTFGCPVEFFKVKNIIMYEALSETKLNTWTQHLKDLQDDRFVIVTVKEFDRDHFYKLLNKCHIRRVSEMCTRVLNSRVSYFILIYLVNSHYFNKLKKKLRKRDRIKENNDL